MAATPSAGARVVWAFDFDGVIVDSARETGMAAIMACREVFGDNIIEGSQHYYDVLDKFLIVRPCLETGWEAILMVHLVHEGNDPLMVRNQFQSVLKRELLQGYGLQEDALKASLQSVRDAWIARDPEHWFQAHGFYSDSVAALKVLAEAAASSPDVQVFIITTKNKELTLRLLAACAISIPSDHVFGLGSGKKADILHRILEEHPAASSVFIEDRLETLITVHEREAMRARVHLVLASWGYNTAEEHAKARELGMHVIVQDELARVAKEDRTLEQQTPFRSKP